MRLIRMPIRANSDGGFGYKAIAAVKHETTMSTTKELCLVDLISSPFQYSSFEVAAIIIISICGLSSSFQLYLIAF